MPKIEGDKIFMTEGETAAFNIPILGGSGSFSSPSNALYLGTSDKSADTGNTYLSGDPSINTRDFTTSKIVAGKSGKFRLFCYIVDGGNTALVGPPGGYHVNVSKKGAA